MTSARERIGFVGVGLMGHGMAKNIIEAGYPMTIMGHRNRAPVEDMRQRGASEADKVADLAAGSDIVFLCLPGSPQVEAVVAEILADKGLVHTIVDCSTANPVSTRTLAEACRAAGIAMVDAPLARTPKEAWEGQLDTMVGASEADFTRLEPLFASWAARIVRLKADPERPGGYSEFRATYGGLFLMLHLTALLMVLQAPPAMALAAVLPVSAGWFGAAIGRVFSMSLDRGKGGEAKILPVWMGIETSIAAAKTWATRRRLKPFSCRGC